MKKKFINSLILLAVLFIVHQVSMAQPPPPHPGGSGNQGAAIEGFAYMIGLAAVFGAWKLKK